MTQKEKLKQIRELRNWYHREKSNTGSREFKLYYAGSEDALNKAIQIITS